VLRHRKADDRVNKRKASWVKFEGEKFFPTSHGGKKGWGALREVGSSGDDHGWGRGDGSRNLLGARKKGDGELCQGKEEGAPVGSSSKKKTLARPAKHFDYCLGKGRKEGAKQRERKKNAHAFTVELKFMDHASGEEGDRSLHEVGGRGWNLSRGGYRRSREELGNKIATHRSFPSLMKKEEYFLSFEGREED